MMEAKPVSELEDLIAAAPEKLDPDSRREAARYVPFTNLLATGRAIKKQSNSLILHFAGDDPKRVRIRYLSGKAAKRGQMLLLMNLRRAKTDFAYNRILHEFLSEIEKAKQIAAAQAERSAKVEHVHNCTGTSETDCSFDWSRHTLNDEGECICNPQFEHSAEAARNFIVHQELA